MRNCLFRVLAVALLILAIPLQGVASVAAGQCVAFGHDQGEGGQEHEHHAHDDGAAGGHDHAKQDHADEGKSAHCGPCTACCASASIAGPVGLAIPGAAATAKYLFQQAPPRGVQPLGFDRPPLAL